MKNNLTLTWAILLSLAPLAIADVTIPEKIQGELALIERKLDAARAPGDYVTDAYLADLTKLGKGLEPELLAQLRSEKELNRSEILLLQSSWMQDDSIVTATKEIDMCYGRPAYAVPEKLQFKLARLQGETTIRIYTQEEQNRTASGRMMVLPLYKEHKKPDYRPAYEILLMSPPSRPREIMKNRVFEGLLAIGDPSSIPVLLEGYKKETGLAASQESKRAVAMQWINVIRGIPSGRAIDALLECNRLAVDGDYNGEERSGLSRHIVRSLSSRRLYADQMDDPEMVKMLKKSGQTVDKAEDVPPFDDKWKTYKPLLQKKLKEKTKETPAADIAVMTAALAAMPAK